MLLPKAASAPAVSTSTSDSLETSCSPESAAFLPTAVVRVLAILDLTEAAAPDRIAACSKTEVCLPGGFGGCERVGNADTALAVRTVDGIGAMSASKGVGGDKAGEEPEASPRPASK